MLNTRGANVVYKLLSIFVKHPVRTNGAYSVLMQLMFRYKINTDMEVNAAPTTYRRTLILILNLISCWEW